jgi:poly(A) polymerase
MSWVTERMAPIDPFHLKWMDDPSVQAVMTSLGAQDLQARFVGGCVRNSLLELPITDIDIATVHPPAETTRRLDNAGITAKATGITHGTVTAILDGRSFEITTLRHDIETDGRHAVVAFTDDWAEDAARRDFTMNALFMDLNGEILDPIKGQNDALHGRVRFVGEPARRIEEDALRILRFFRFQAQYGRGPMDPNGLDACERNAALQAKLSGERIRAELLKLLDARGANSVTRSMVGAGILAPLFQGEPNIDALGRLIALETEIDIAQPDALRRLAILLAPTGEATADRLRLSNAECVRFLAISTDRLDLGASETALKAKLYKIGPVRYVDAVLVTAALEHLESTLARTALEIARTWIPPSFPLRGGDLIKLGLAPGERVGRILARAEDLWISDGMRGDRDACLAWARQAFEQDWTKT